MLDLCTGKNYNNGDLIMEIQINNFYGNFKTRFSFRDKNSKKNFKIKSKLIKKAIAKILNLRKYK